MEQTSGWIMLWGVFSTNGADKIRTVVGEMTFLPAVEAGRITHVFRVWVQLLEDWFWGWRGQVNDHLWGQCLDHLGRGGCGVVSVR